MTDTTWMTTAARSGGSPAGHESATGRAIARFWMARALKPLHRALDSALRAGELGGLNPGTLADIGYRRG